jgi:hypothetical protein
MTKLSNYGSLTNYFMVNTKGQPEPVVGQYVTVVQYSDRWSGTIHEVQLYKSGPRKGMVRRIMFTRDKCCRVDSYGMSDTQYYECLTVEPKEGVDSSGDKWSNHHWANRTRSGKFRLDKYTYLIIGLRENYHDFSF